MAEKIKTPNEKEEKIAEASTSGNKETEKKKSKADKQRQKVAGSSIGKSKKIIERSDEIVCKDKDCPTHGNLKSRGKVFEGKVIRKFHKRIAIEFERMAYVRKYERYKKLRTKVHARLPICMEKGINVGDVVKIQECRPLSKIIHFVVIEKIKETEK